MDARHKWNAFMEGNETLMLETGERVVKYSLSASDSAIYCCILWPGVFLWANDVRDRYLPAYEGIRDDYITLNYCLAGRCETGTEDSDVFIYMEPGTLCVDDHKPPGGYHYPSKQYKGVEFAFVKDPANEQFPDELESVGVHLRDVISSLSHVNGTLIGGLSESIHELMQFMYDHLISGDLSIEDYRYYSIRILYGLLHGGCVPKEIGAYITKGQRAIANEIEEIITSDLSRRYAISDLAERYGVSASAVKRYFAIVYGDNISGYLREKRMELAKNLLETSSMSVRDISTATGYSHQGKFGKAFKDSTGLTPLEYRRRNYMKGTNYED